MFEIPKFMLIETIPLLRFFAIYLITVVLLKIISMKYRIIKNVHSTVVLFGTGLAIGFMLITVTNSTVDCKCQVGEYNLTPYSLEKIGFTQLLPPPRWVDIPCLGYMPLLPQAPIAEAINFSLPKN